MGEEKGVKLDSGKRDWTLLPFSALDVVVKVLEFGLKKYSRDNWQLVPDGHDRYIKAAFRHLIAYAEGEKKDPESGENHLGHALCCLLFALWFDLQDAGQVTDDLNLVRPSVMSEIYALINTCTSHEELRKVTKNIKDTKWLLRHNNTVLNCAEQEATFTMLCNKAIAIEGVMQNSASKVVP